MTKPVSAVPNQFATATSTIPLSYLDSDFSTVVGYLNDLNNYSNYVADTGTANAIVLNYPAGITSTSISTGTQLQFKAANANTGATTLTVQINSSNILSSTSVINEDGTALSANEILANGVYSVTYNGTNWLLVGGGAGSGASAGGAIYENTQSINANYTMTTGKNGESVGPITIASGVTVTIPSGSRWVVL